jgi:hypothetical protein
MPLVPLLEFGDILKNIALFDFRQGNPPLSMPTISAKKGNKLKIIGRVPIIIV